MSTKPHPDYPFNPKIKGMVYDDLYRFLDGEEVRLACSFPHLSGYRMEAGVVARHPGAFFHCFEMDPLLFGKILTSFPRPKYVSMINSEAEEFILRGRETYDFMFFDYMSGPKRDILPLLRDHLREGGTFALTEYVGRGRKRTFTPRTGFRVLHVGRYGQMEVRLFRREDGAKVEEPAPMWYRGSAPSSRKYLLRANTRFKSTSSLEKNVEAVGLPGAGLPAIENRDVKMIEGYFEPKLVDLFSTLVETSSFTQTAEILNSRWKGSHFYKYQVRIRWRQMYQKVEKICSLSKHHQERLGKIRDFMGAIDRCSGLLREAGVTA